jgi:peroxiredoxin
MLDIGVRAPDFRAKDLDGSEVSLSQLLKNGPVLVGFLKISCPTCQYTFPYLQRMADRGGLTVVGVSQDEAGPTRKFCQAFGVRFPVLLDSAAAGYPVSNAYKLTNVPSLFLIEPDGMISASFMGFSKADLEAIGSRFEAPPFLAGEDIPSFRPG